MENNIEIPLDNEQRAPGIVQEPVTGETLVIPVIGERVRVEKKIVESGKVKITKTVREEQETINIPVSREEVVVERVPVNRFVENAPQIRYEGETMIVPVVREVVVVEKRIELVEELRITKQIIQTQSSQQVTLRREEVTVDRQPAEPGVLPGF